MILQIEISEQLTDAISTNYDKGNYTAAILDAVFMLSNILRDRSGSQIDGIALVSEALGGQDPKLKITPLRTESDKNIQKGIESIIRGIIQAIRNPRSHEKHADQKEVADCLIAFLDYIIGLLNRAKAPFEIADFLSRILDKDFVQSEPYSDLMVSEIPKEKLNDVLMSVYQVKSQLKPYTMKLFVNSLFKELLDADKQAFIKMASDELKITDDEAAIRSATTVFSGEEWLKIERIARLRIENKLIKSVREGKYDTSIGKCTNGSLGTWLTGIFPEIELRNEVMYTLIKKLSSPDRLEQDYVFNYFSQYLIDFDKKPNDSLIKLIKEGLVNGDKRYYDLINLAVMFSEEDWAKEIKPLLESFQENPAEENEEDIPF